MTRDEAVAMIKLQLGFRSNQDANIVTCLKLAQTQLELQPVRPWFLISEDNYAVLTPDEQRLALPTDFLEEVEDAVLRYVPDDAESVADEIDLVKDDYDVLRKNYRNWVNPVNGLATGAPEAYCLLDGYFRFFPTPDAAYTVHMIYYAGATVLDSNVENAWLKHAPLALMGKAGKMIAVGPLRDATAAQVFADWEAQGSLALHGRNISREQANHTRQIGGRHV